MTKQLNIKLPSPEFHKQLKIQCATDDRSISEVCLSLMQAYIDGRIDADAKPIRTKRKQ